MKKTFKNLLSIFLITTLTSSTIMTTFASQTEAPLLDTEQTETIIINGEEINMEEINGDNIYENIPKFIDPNVIKRLDILGLEYTVEDGIITLKYPTEDNILKFNNSINIKTRATYPTAWVPMKQYNTVHSKKFTKATKSAFATALGTWLKTRTSSWEALAATAAIAFGTYYFVNSDVEDVYNFVNYSFREVGDGRFDSWGNYVGNYEIKKNERITKNSNNTGGQTRSTTQKSTIITPTF